MPITWCLEADGIFWGGGGEILLMKWKVLFKKFLISLLCTYFNRKLNFFSSCTEKIMA